MRKSCFISRVITGKTRHPLKISIRLQFIWAELIIGDNNTIFLAFATKIVESPYIILVFPFTFQIKENTGIIQTKRSHIPIKVIPLSFQISFN